MAQDFGSGSDTNFAVFSVHIHSHRSPLPLTNINTLPPHLWKITHTTQRYGLAAQPGRNPNMHRPFVVILFILLTLAALAEIGFLSFG